MMHKATFLSYRPSQIASTALLVAIDLNKEEKPATGCCTARATNLQSDTFEQMSTKQ